jgi:hypothetical protein
LEYMLNMVFLHLLCALQTGAAWKVMHAALNHMYRSERMAYTERTKRPPPGPADLYGTDCYKEWQKSVYDQLLQQNDGR